MPPTVLFLGVSAFLLCLSAHVMLWRFCRPRHELPVLLLLFFLGGLLLLFVLRGSLSRIDWLATFLLHLALSCGYIQLYPASQAESPSVTLLTTVSRSMPRL